jgi:hypothetical protein
MVNPGDDGIALKNKAPMESVDIEEIHLLSISEAPWYRVNQSCAVSIDA